MKENLSLNARNVYNYIYYTLHMIYKVICNLQTKTPQIMMQRFHFLLTRLVSHGA